VRVQLIMAVVMVHLHCCVFNRSLHALDLAIVPRMVCLDQATFNFIYLTRHIKAHSAQKGLSPLIRRHMM
jgi:hypothetical protein